MKPICRESSRRSRKRRGESHGSCRGAAQWGPRSKRPALGKLFCFADLLDKCPNFFDQLDSRCGTADCLRLLPRGGASILRIGTAGNMKIIWTRQLFGSGGVVVKFMGTLRVA